MRANDCLLLFVFMAPCACAKAPPAPPRAEAPPAPTVMVAREAPSTIASPPPDAAPPPPSPETIAAIDAEIQWRVDGGFDARDVIIDRTTAFVALKEHRSDLGPLIAHEVDTRLDDHATKEASWRERTDAEKIDHAFLALETDGILARQNYKETDNEAEEAIAEEVKRLKTAGRKLRGWVFFSAAGTRTAVLENRLVIQSGATSPTGAAIEAVDSDVLARLQGAGLTADWPYRNGAYLITVSGLDWKKRRAGHAGP